MALPRVLLVDDHALFRDGIAALLRVGGLEVVGQASDGAEALSLARELHPDLVLMDLRMPGVSGLDATRAIKTEMPRVKVVILTVSDGERDLFEAIKSGADGYILKNTPGKDFSEMLSRVFQGESVISSSLAAMIFDELRQGQQPPNSGPETEENLTEREMQVLQLSATGTTNKEIGIRLDISGSTVNFHIQNILSKLHLRNRTEAAIYAVRKGLIRIPDDPQ